MQLSSSVNVLVVFMKSRIGRVPDVVKRFPSCLSSVTNGVIGRKEEPLKRSPYPDRILQGILQFVFRKPLPQR